MRNHLLNRLGKKLRKRRTGSGLTQREIAEEARLTQQALSLIERGQVDPSLLTLLSICDALMCSLREVLDGEVMAGFRPGPGRREMDRPAG